MTFLDTVTRQDAECFPAVAVITVEPSASAETIPYSSTEATEPLEVVHFTVLSVASAGYTVATSIVVCPSSIVTDVRSRVIDVTSTGFLFTVTTQVADLPPDDAVIVVCPSAMAFTSPLEFTVATDCFEEAHVSVLSVASAGRTVAIS